MAPVACMDAPSSSGLRLRPVWVWQECGNRAHVEEAQSGLLPETDRPQKNRWCGKNQVTELDLRRCGGPACGWCHCGADWVVCR